MWYYFWCTIIKSCVIFKDIIMILFEKKKIATIFLCKPFSDSVSNKKNSVKIHNKLFDAMATTSCDRNTNRRRRLKKVKLKNVHPPPAWHLHSPQTAMCQMIHGMINFLPDPVLQDTSLGTCRDWLLWILCKIMAGWGQTVGWIYKVPLDLLVNSSTTL